MPTAKKAETVEFINASTNNIFTEEGTCRPGEKVSMNPDFAKFYKGLEPAATYKEPEKEEDDSDA